MADVLTGGHDVDHELVVAVRGGDAAAFAVLFDHHHGKLVRHLVYLTGDGELAADLAQDAFFDAFRHLDQLAAEGSFHAWLYGIAHNRLRMDRRRRQVRRLVSLEWLSDTVSSAIPALQREDESGTCHDRDQFGRLLAELSPPLREALVLHSVDGFTAPEVAKVLGISLSAAERRISRAKTEFRSRWRAADGEA
jgi:RNA polymerase sigma-70 factor (ECF subfamily)